MSANLFWHEQPSGFAEYLDHEVCDDYRQNLMFLLAAIRNHGFYTAAHFPSGGRIFKDLAVDTLTAQNFMPRKVGIDKAHYYGDQTTLIRVECGTNGDVTNIAYTGLDANRLESLKTFLEPYSKKRVYPRPEGRFYMLGYRNHELYFHQLGAERSRFVPANYSASVRDHFKYVAHQISARNPDGRLVLIDGPSGTGKTHFLRALAHKVKDRVKVVIVPAHMIQDMTNPDTVPLLASQSVPIVLVLEDADFALHSRTGLSNGPETAKGNSHTHALSSILNLSDGIVGAAIDIRIVTTTNVTIEHLDPALTRAGRLIRRVTVGALSRDEALAIVARESRKDPAAIETHVTGPMTLADAYNIGKTLR